MLILLCVNLEEEIIIICSFSQPDNLILNSVADYKKLNLIYKLNKTKQQKSVYSQKRFHHLSKELDLLLMRNLLSLWSCSHIYSRQNTVSMG